METDKLTMDIEAVASGILAGVSAEVGQTVPVTTVIAYLLQPGEDATYNTFSGRRTASAGNPTQSRKTNRSATPLAARIAAAEGVDLKEISGSGPDGKITKADIIARVSGAEVQESAAETTIPEVTGQKRPAKCAPHRQPNGWRREKGVDLKSLTGSGLMGRIQEKTCRKFDTAFQLADAQEKAPDLGADDSLERHAPYHCGPHAGQLPDCPAHPVNQPDRPDQPEPDSQANERAGQGAWPDPHFRYCLIGESNRLDLDAVSIYQQLADPR